MPTVVKGASRTWVVEPELSASSPSCPAPLELEGTHSASDSDADDDLLSCACVEPGRSNWERLLRQPLCACRSPEQGEEPRLRDVLSTPAKHNPSPATSFHAGGNSGRRRNGSGARSVKQAATSKALD
eukprot:scaffold73564_cov35-Tisochrysis_lutea.AAC.1